MKKNFLLLCGMLLSFGFFAACTENQEAPEPTFPEVVTINAVAGDVIEIDFTANYDWTATISEESYTYFQLLSGEGDNLTTTKSVSGFAGENTLRVSVSSKTVYESVPSAEVTLTMKDLSQVIATIHYPVTERLISVYAPIKTEYGSFKTSAYGSEFNYVYEETTVSEETVINTLWGTVRGSDAVESFFAPVMISANFEYTVAGPEWMGPSTAGEIGTQEHILGADRINIPAESEISTINILIADTETPVASFKASILGYNDFAFLSGFEESYSYTYEGEPSADAVEGYMTAAETYISIICDATGAEVDWVTLTEDYVSEKGDIIHDYTIGVEVEANNSNDARTAYIFLFAKNTVPKEASHLFEDGVVKEAFAANLATTIVQHTAPATIEGAQVDETCATFNEVGDDFANSWFFEDLHVYLGSTYELNYWGEWAIYGHEATMLTASRAIESLTCYHYNDMGSLVEVSEDGWVSAMILGPDSNNIKVYCEDLSIIPEAAKNFQNGDGEAVILVKYTDGTYSAIYFHIGAGAAAGGDDVTEVTFVDPMSAQMYGATLVQLTEADADLYDASAVDNSGNPIPQYHLTYTMPGTILGLSLPSYDFAYPQAEWIMYEGNSSELYVGMMVEEAAIGVLNFYKGSMCNVRIVCEFAPATGGDDEGDDEGGSTEEINWDYVCGAYQITEWSSPYWNTDATQRFSKLGYGFWYNYVKLASDCTTGADKPCGTPKDGQRYGLVYSYNNHAFFDISSTEIDPATWEPKEGTGCYALLNMIDREKDTDHIENNYSYYDKNEDAFYISFTLTSGGKVYRHDGKMHSRGTVDMKEP